MNLDEISVKSGILLKDFWNGIRKDGTLYYLLRYAKLMCFLKFFLKQTRWREITSSTLKGRSRMVSYVWKEQRASRGSRISEAQL